LACSYTSLLMVSICRQIRRERVADYFAVLSLLLCINTKALKGEFPLKYIG